MSADQAMVSTMNLCRGCGERLDPLLYGFGLHPMCVDAVADQVELELRAIITWASRTSDRSLQKHVGPSELGTPCDRRLAYRLAGSPTFNESDPLISVVGTGLHSWLEEAILRFKATFADDTLLTETQVVFDDEGSTGRSDLYHRQLQAVIDFKSAGADVLKKLPDVGPEPAYRVQAHLYGSGYLRAGLPVRDVMIVYLPRSGLLKSITAWREPYNPDIVAQALQRRDNIRQRLASTPKVKFSDFSDEGVSQKDCWFCPFKGGNALLGPTELGCPGR